MLLFHGQFITESKRRGGGGGRGGGGFISNFIMPKIAVLDWTISVFFMSFAYEITQLLSPREPQMVSPCN